MIKKNSEKYDSDNNQELQPAGFLKIGVLEVLPSWKNQTVLQCLKHHRKIFWQSNQQRDLFLLISRKRKTFYTIILAIMFYYGSKKKLRSVEFLLP